MKKLVGYVRESTMAQVKDGFNMEDQERSIKMYCDLYYQPGEYELVIMHEKGRSAKSLNRPEMKKLIAMTEHREYDALIVYSLDRLTRNVVDMAKIVKDFDDNAIDLISVHESVNTHSPQGRFFVYLISLIGQWEREILIARTEHGMAESARQGNYVKGKVPLGYKRREDDHGKLEIIPGIKNTIIHIFKDVAERDMPVNAIAARMSNVMILDRKWTENSVRKILNCDEYYGTMIFSKKKYVNQVPAIISKELFDLAHEKMDGRHHVMLNRYVYKGRCYCSYCKKPLTVSCNSSHKNRRYNYYYCSKCRKMINEKVITEQMDAQFTKKMREVMFETEIEKLQGKYAHAVTLLRRASYAYVTYGLTEAFYDSLIDSASQDANDIKKRILQESNRIEHLSFASLTYREQRDFVLENVAKMVIDVTKKDVLDVQFAKYKPLRDDITIDEPQYTIEIQDNMICN